MSDLTVSRPDHPATTVTGDGAGSAATFGNASISFEDLLVRVNLRVDSDNKGMGELGSIVMQSDALTAATPADPGRDPGGDDPGRDGGDADIFGFDRDDRRPDASAAGNGEDRQSAPTPGTADRGEARTAAAGDDGSRGAANGDDKGKADGGDAGNDGSGDGAQANAGGGDGNAADDAATPNTEQAAAAATPGVAAHIRTGGDGANAGSQAVDAVGEAGGASGRSTDTSGGSTARGGGQGQAGGEQAATNAANQLRVPGNNGAAGGPQNPELARQAADLSRATQGAGPMQVSVTVGSEAETLVSQPVSTLAAAAVLAGESGKSQAGQNAQTARAPTGLNTPAQQAAQAAVAGATVQQAANAGVQQAGAAQLAAQAAGGVKPAAVLGSQAVTPNGQTAMGGDGGLGAGSGQPSATQQTQSGAQTQAANQPRFMPFQRAVIEQVSVHITKAVADGADRINIQLKPPSLGRIEVQLEVAKDGRVVANVTVDNRDTYEMLRGDARGLERALQDAGLNTDSGSLNFNLREQGERMADAQSGGGKASGEAGDGGGEAGSGEPQAEAEAPKAANPYAGARASGGVSVVA